MLAFHTHYSSDFHLRDFHPCTLVPRFLQRAPRSHFLTDRHDLYAIARISAEGCASCRSQQYSTTFWGSNLQETSPKLAGMGILPQNRRSSKIAIYRSLTKTLTSNFTDRLTTKNIIKEMQSYVKGSHKGVTWPTFRILGPLHIPKTVEARNFKFGKHIENEGL